MQTKLTLRLESDLIQRAKAYSKRTGKSLSRMVADYFALLDSLDSEPGSALPPKTRSLLGALRGADVGEEEYREQLVQKYG